MASMAVLKAARVKPLPRSSVELMEESAAARVAAFSAAAEVRLMRAITISFDSEFGDSISLT